MVTAKPDKLDRLEPRLGKEFFAGLEKSMKDNGGVQGSPIKDLNQAGWPQVPAPLNPNHPDILAQAEAIISDPTTGVNVARGRPYGDDDKVVVQPHERKIEWVPKGHQFPPIMPPVPPTDRLGVFAIEAIGNETDDTAKMIETMGEHLADQVSMLAKEVQAQSKLFTERAQQLKLMVESVGANIASTTQDYRSFSNRVTSQMERCTAMAERVVKACEAFRADVERTSGVLAEEVTVEMQP